MLQLKTHTRARLPVGHPPVLTVIVDTEEEFDWNQPFSRNNTQTESIAAQPLAHREVFDALGIVPTYVVDWPVATNLKAVAVLRELMERGQCEVGTHLHPWVSPPYTEEVNRFNSYAGNLPQALEFEKIRLLTDVITQNFGKAPQVFKAGRYGVGPHTAESIAKLGYTIDASVVPYTALTSDGGPDFSQHDAHPFWFGSDDNRLLELPATAGYSGFLHSSGPRLYPILQTNAARRMRLPGIASRLGALERIKLTPEGYSADELIRLTEAMLKDGCQVFGLTYHSPSLVPGNTSYVKSAQELSRFLKVLNEYLSWFFKKKRGQFLSASKISNLLT